MAEDVSVENPLPVSLDAQFRVGPQANATSAATALDTLPIRQYLSTLPTLTNNYFQHGLVDINGADQTNLATLLSGEDQTYNRMMVMPRYTYSAVATADVQIKASPGILHSVTFSPNDAVPTAGSIIIYDSLTEANTQVFNWNIAATAFLPFTVILDYNMLTGIYIGFTTTADVNVSCAYL